MRVTASALSVLAAALFFPKGISAICNSFSGANAATDALAWCDTLDNKCCTDDDGNVSAIACGNWGPNAEYNLCEGSCHGTYSCFDMLKSAATGSSILIEGCVGNSTCEYFAENVDGNVTASIGKGACSGESSWACKWFLQNGSGNITVDIQDGACYGLAVCQNVFQNAGSGTSIVIKEKGCVGDTTCRFFAVEHADGNVTASIGKGACSGGAKACYQFLGSADKVSMIDIQDGACTGVYRPCDGVGYGADNLQSLTVPAGECSDRFACNSCASDSTFDGGLNVTSACCWEDNTENEDDACIIPAASSSSPLLRHSAGVIAAIYFFTFVAVF